MDVDGFLESLRSDPSYRGQIVHVHREPARMPRWAGTPDSLHPGANGFLTALGVSRLYALSLIHI